MMETHHKLQPELATQHPLGPDAQCYRLASIPKIGVFCPSLVVQNNHKQAMAVSLGREGQKLTAHPNQPPWVTLHTCLPCTLHGHFPVSQFVSSATPKKQSEAKAASGRLPLTIC